MKNGSTVNVGEKTKKERVSNLELLKVICMFFVISLHICTQTGIAHDPVSVFDSTLFFVFSEFGRTACTVFLMISAWFLSRMEFKIERFLKSWLKTLIYLLLVYFLIYHNYELPWYEFLPLGGGLLWFVSVYLFLLLASPLLQMLNRFCPFL